MKTAALRSVKKKRPCLLPLFGRENNQEKCEIRKFFYDKIYPVKMVSCSLEFENDGYIFLAILKDVL